MRYTLFAAMFGAESLTFRPPGVFVWSKRPPLKCIRGGVQKVDQSYTRRWVRQCCCTIYWNENVFAAGLVEHTIRDVKKYVKSKRRFAEQQLVFVFGYFSMPLFDTYEVLCCSYLIVLLPGLQ